MPSTNPLVPQQQPVSPAKPLIEVKTQVVHGSDTGVLSAQSPQSVIIPRGQVAKPQSTTPSASPVQHSIASTVSIETETPQIAAKANVGSVIVPRGQTRGTLLAELDKYKSGDTYNFAQFIKDGGNLNTLRTLKVDSDTISYNVALSKLLDYKTDTGIDVAKYLKSNTDLTPLKGIGLDDKTIAYNQSLSKLLDYKNESGNIDISGYLKKNTDVSPLLGIGVTQDTINNVVSANKVEAIKGKDGYTIDKLGSAVLLGTLTEDDVNRIFGSDTLNTVKTIVQAAKTREMSTSAESQANKAIWEAKNAETWAKYNDASGKPDAVKLNDALKSGELSANHIESRFGVGSVATIQEVAGNIQQVAANKQIAQQNLNSFAKLGGFQKDDIQGMISQGLSVQTAIDAGIPIEKVRGAVNNILYEVKTQEGQIAAAQQLQQIAQQQVNMFSKLGVFNQNSPTYYKDMINQGLNPQTLVDSGVPYTTVKKVVDDINVESLALKAQYDAQQVILTSIDAKLAPYKVISVPSSPTMASVSQSKISKEALQSGEITGIITPSYYLQDAISHGVVTKDELTTRFGKDIADKQFTIYYATTPLNVPANLRPTLEQYRAAIKPDNVSDVEWATVSKFITPKSVDLLGIVESNVKDDVITRALNIGKDKITEIRKDYGYLKTQDLINKYNETSMQVSKELELVKNPLLAGLGGLTLAVTSIPVGMTSMTVEGIAKPSTLLSVPGQIVEGLVQSGITAVSPLSSPVQRGEAIGFLGANLVPFGKGGKGLKAGEVREVSAESVVKNELINQTLKEISVAGKPASTVAFIKDLPRVTLNRFQDVTYNLQVINDIADSIMKGEVSDAIKGQLVTATKGLVNATKQAPGLAVAKWQDMVFASKLDKISELSYKIMSGEISKDISRELVSEIKDLSNAIKQVPGISVKALQDMTFKLDNINTLANSVMSGEVSEAITRELSNETKDLLNMVKQAPGIVVTKWQDVVFAAKLDKISELADSIMKGEVSNAIKNELVAETKSLITSAGDLVTNPTGILANRGKLIREVAKAYGLTLPKNITKNVSDGAGGTYYTHLDAIGLSKNMRKWTKTNAIMVALHEIIHANIGSKYTYYNIIDMIRNSGYYDVVQYTVDNAIGRIKKTYPAVDVPTYLGKFISIYDAMNEWFTIRKTGNLSGEYFHDYAARISSDLEGVFTADEITTLRNLAYKLADEDKSGIKLPATELAKRLRGVTEQDIRNMLVNIKEEPIKLLQNMADNLQVINDIADSIMKGDVSNAIKTQFIYEVNGLKRTLNNIKKEVPVIYESTIQGLNTRLDVVNDIAKSIMEDKDPLIHMDYLKKITRDLKADLTTELKIAPLERVLQSRLSIINDRFNKGDISELELRNEVESLKRSPEWLQHKALKQELANRFWDRTAEYYDYKVGKLDKTIEGIVRNLFLGDDVSRMATAYDLKWNINNGNSEGVNQLIEQLKLKAGELPTELKDATIKEIEAVKIYAEEFIIKSKKQPVTEAEIADKLVDAIKHEENELDNAIRLRERQKDPVKQQTLDDQIAKRKKDIETKKVQLAEKVKVEIPLETFISPEEAANLPKPARVEETTKLEEQDKKVIPDETNKTGGTEELSSKSSRVVPSKTDDRTDTGVKITPIRNTDQYWAIVWENGNWQYKLITPSELQPGLVYRLDENNKTRFDERVQELLRSMTYEQAVRQVSNEFGADFSSGIKPVDITEFQSMSQVKPLEVTDIKTYPSQEVEPSPQPLPEPKPEPYPVKPPPPLEEPKRTAKKVILSVKKKDKETQLEKKREDFSGSFVFKWGFGYWAVKAPYATQKDIAFFRTPPPNAVIMPDAKNIYQTIQQTTGKPPSKQLIIPIGIQTIYIRKPPSKPGAKGVVSLKMNKAAKKGKATGAVRIVS